MNAQKIDLLIAGGSCIRRIHPAFKYFIMNDAAKRWDKILKEDGVDLGIEGGVCFSTSNAFCKILERDFNIPCRLEMVETIAGNQHSIDLFDYYADQKDPKAFFAHLAELNKRKGKENLTPDDPVVVGMGAGGKPEQFHFIMNLPNHGEAVDLTLSRVDRPQWGIKCNNYWAKYDRSLYKNGAIISNEIRRASNCVVMTTKKRTPGRVGIRPDEYRRQEDKIRSYINKQVKTRNIPIFLRR